jgi:anhydro-N-acetylmuramic acid kinase
LRRQLPEWADERPADIQATLAELSGSQPVRCDPYHAAPNTERVLICGGGAHNHHSDPPGSRAEWTAQSSPALSTAWTRMRSKRCLFAWLAREQLAGRRVDTRSITGASAI